MRAMILAAGIALIAACKTGDGPTGIPTEFELLPSTLASCGSGNALYTALPIAQANIGGWVPLGAMNPSGHTFPTDHQYIYLKSFGASSVGPVDVYAPANVTIVGARRSQYGGPTPFEDYSIMFSACKETWIEFGHVRSIAPNIAAKLPPFDQGCNTYSPNPGSTVSACWTKPTDIKVNAGDVIATTSGLDLWMFDSRITPLVFANPARWGGMSAGFDHFHVVPFSDYFAEPLRTTVQGMLGSYDGTVKRTIPPLGGTIGTDIAGTVQGTWFFGVEPTYPESPHLAIVPDNVDPTIIDISMGVSGGTFTSNLYRFTPASSGFVNRHPAQITPGAAVYCFDLHGNWGIALIQLVDATTLKIEGRLGFNFDCANAQPFAFTGAAVTYQR